MHSLHFKICLYYSWLSAIRVFNFFHGKVLSHKVYIISWLFHETYQTNANLARPTKHLCHLAKLSIPYRIWCWWTFLNTMEMWCLQNSLEIWWHLLNPTGIWWSLPNYMEISWAYSKEIWWGLLNSKEFWWNFMNLFKI